MESLIYVLLISLSAPLFMMMLLVEKKARQPIIFVLIGVFISVFAAEVNSLLKDFLGMDVTEATVSLAPITEELLKALPVLFFATAVTDRRETLFTVSMSLGIGFALLENAYYLLVNIESFSLISALIRGFGTGLMHGMCTLIVGFGISFVRKKKKIFAVGTFALLTAAITYHAIFNMLIASEYQIIGALLPIATYVPFFVWRLNSRRKKKSARRRLK